MGKNKRPFIDRKKAVSFRLLHRSQKDPLIADDSLGERVLHPISSDSKELQERHKFGIYYRDAYDYLQHLKEVGEAVEIIGGEPIVEREMISAGCEDDTDKQFNSCIFETRGVELKVGVLNRAAPSTELLPDIDPDIVAALDDEIGTSGAYDDELDDDFVAKANAPGGKGEGELFDFRDENRGRDEILQRFGLRNARGKISDESSIEDTEKEEADSSAPSEVGEQKTTFTNYSMSSSVIKRPDGMRMIDDHFETLYEMQYAVNGGDENGEGAEGEGRTMANSEHFLFLLEEQTGLTGEERCQRKLPDRELKEAVLRDAKTMEEDDLVGRGQTEAILMDSTKKSRWDCESILST